MSATTILKSCFIVVCLLVTFLFGYAPMKIEGCSKNRRILGVLNTFSGGVFLAIAFVHILPETANLYYSTKLQNALEAQQTSSGFIRLGTEGQDENTLLVSDQNTFALEPKAKPGAPLVETAVNGMQGLTTEQIELIIEDYSSAFPLPFVLVVLGYGFILLIDRVIIDSGAHNHGGD